MADQSLELRRRAVVTLALAMADLEAVATEPGCHLIRGKLVEAQALAAWCWPDAFGSEESRPKDAGEAQELWDAAHDRREVAG